MYICNVCSKRRCRKNPVPIRSREGRYTCKFLQPIRGGWTILELILDTSPKETLEMLHGVGLEVIKTKSGYKCKPRRVQ